MYAKTKLKFDNVSTAGKHYSSRTSRCNHAKEWVNIPLDAYLRDEPFSATDCTSTDNQTDDNHEKKHTKTNPKTDNLLLVKKNTQKCTNENPCLIN